MYNGLYEAMTLYELYYMGVFPICAAQGPLDTDISSNIYHLPSDADEADPQLPKFGPQAPQAFEGLLVSRFQMYHLIDVLPRRSPRTGYRRPQSNA